MPDPYTISDAFSMLVKNNKNNNNNKSTTSMSTSSKSSVGVGVGSGGVDIIGIVVGISFVQSPSTSIQRASIFITDPSLISISSSISSISSSDNNNNTNHNNNHNNVCRVTLFGSTELSRLVTEQISNGDIIRFNQVSLSLLNNNNYNNSNNNKELFDMEFTYPRDRIGGQWYRLGRTTTTTNNHNTNQIQQQQRNIPNDFITSNNRLQQLMKFSILECLTPLPCRKRELYEISSSVGLLSNICVKVTDYECRRMNSSIRQSLTRKRKNNRNLTTTTRACTTNFINVGFATFHDSTKNTTTTRMLFVDTSNKYEKILQEASSITIDRQNNNKKVMLTNVYSMNLVDVDMNLFRSTSSSCDSSNDDIVLVPTKATTATIINNVTPSLRTNNTNNNINYHNNQGEFIESQDLINMNMKNSQTTQYYSECSWWLSQQQQQQQQQHQQQQKQKQQRMLTEDNNNNKEEEEEEEEKKQDEDYHTKGDRNKNNDGDGDISSDDDNDDDGHHHRHSSCSYAPLPCSNSFKDGDDNMDHHSSYTSAMMMVHNNKDTSNISPPLSQAALLPPPISSQESQKKKKRRTTTQSTKTKHGSNDDGDDDEETYNIVVGSIRDIVIGGMSIYEILNLDNHCDGNNNDDTTDDESMVNAIFIKTVLTKNKQSYKSAEIYLFDGDGDDETTGEGTKKQCPESSVATRRKLIASPGILQILMGGIDAIELPFFVPQVSKLIRSMILEKIQLHWTILSSSSSSNNDNSSSETTEATKNENGLVGRNQSINNSIMIPDNVSLPPEFSLFFCC